MEKIKEEVNRVLRSEFLTGVGVCKSFTGNQIILIADKLIAIFDKEKKEFALEMLNEYIDKINELIPDFKEYYADSEYFPSQLTATKLEGEK